MNRYGVLASLAVALWGSLCHAQLTDNAALNAILAEQQTANYWLELQYTSTDAIYNTMGTMALDVQANTAEVEAVDEKLDAMAGIVYMILFFNVMFFAFGPLMNVWRSGKGLFARSAAGGPI